MRESFDNVQKEWFCLLLHIFSVRICYEQIIKSLNELGLVLKYQIHAVRAYSTADFYCVCTSVGIWQIKARN